MQNIEQIAQERFSKNLEYLNKHHNIVYNQILSLSINNYDLEYLDGYFDVKELRSGNYLYAQDSTKVSKELASLVNFKKDSYLFEGFPLYYGFEKHKGYGTATHVEAMRKYGRCAIHRQTFRVKALDESTLF